MDSLAVKYRPQIFSQVSEQTSTVKILERQLELKQFKPAYLFSGPSGTGKTTLARIFAKQINGLDSYEPIEVDGATYNGVDSVRALVEESKTRALDADYKVIIIDECHAITSAGWKAFLKTLEEPSPYTIFIFCTTDLQKVPDTIRNRCLKLSLTKISLNSISTRLETICVAEGLKNYKEACSYIARLSQGGMRDAIALLEQCTEYSNDLSMNNVLSVLGNYSYDTLFALTNSIIDKREDIILKIIDSVYNSGKDLKYLVDQYLDFILDVLKYHLFANINMTKFPVGSEIYLNDTLASITSCKPVDFLNKIADKLLSLKAMIKYEVAIKSTVEVALLQLAREL